jgi:hypothetical protein
MSFPSVIQTALEGGAVRCAHLVEFLFKTQTRRLWNGSYKLSANGHDWFGIRKLGTIEGLDDPGNLEAGDMRFTVSGVDPRMLAIIQLALTEHKEEYIDRLVQVWLGFFDEDWQLLDAPIARAAGMMDRIEVTRAGLEDGSSRRTISISAHNIFSGRSSAPASFYTDADQKLRSPGDRGLETIDESVETVVQVPW